MAEFNSSTLGAANDQVTLHLGNETNNEVVICESYDVTLGIFDQPSQFTLRLGTGDLLAQLIAKYPNGSPFRLDVGGQTQFTGYTDGFDSSDGVGASEITFEGRDILAAICETEIEK